MFRTVLIALDGSPRAALALPYASALARASKARLLLAYVPDFWALFPEAPEAVHAAAAEARAAGLDAQVVVCAARYGSLAADLLDTTRDAGADLLVLATHGYGPWGRLLHGSVTDDIVRHATVPVLVAAPQVAPAWPDDRPRRMLLPLDTSDLARSAIGPARDLALAFGAPITLVSLVELSDLLDGEATLTATLEDRLRRRQDYLAGVARMLQGVTTEAVTGIGTPDGTLARLAREKGADLIVMATHGRGGIARMLLGSTATETLRHSSVPVLLVRPAAVTEAAPAEPVVTRPSVLAPAVPLMFTAEERHVLRTGLQRLLVDATTGQQARQHIRALLRKLEDGDG